MRGANVQRRTGNGPPGAGASPPRRCALLLCAVAALALGAPCAARGEVTSLAVWKHIPVLDAGRVMPMDSYARHTLLAISGRSTHDRKPAALWLARVLFTPEATRDDAIFLVNNPEVIEALGIPAEGRSRYTYAQLEPARAKLESLARSAFHLPDESRSPVETELMHLYKNVSTYVNLTEGFRFALPHDAFAVADPELRRALDLPADGDAASLLDLHARADRLMALARPIRGKPAAEQSERERETLRLANAYTMLSARGRSLPPAIIPIHGEGTEAWVGAADIAGGGRFSDELRREIEAVAGMARAFRAGEQVAFDLAGRAFLASVMRRAPPSRSLDHIRTEVRLNAIDPFYRAEMLYGFGFLLALVSVMSRARWIRILALALILLGLVPHTYGILARMAIMGRPPVTNLYATFVFVGWVCVIVALITEYLQRNRLGLLTAGASGLALLLTAARFSTDGDTMGVMVAVLDSNFWLATHVITITIGYAGCCVAGVLGMIYLLQALRHEPGHPLLVDAYHATYGTLAFGLIFSFVGTMLGGVWADQSWGRFWGWDPKENGALVIVLWSAIVFHAKLGRMIGPRGFAAASALGIIGVLCAWLGVNLLNVGLHSYGFTSGLARGLFYACLAVLVFVAITTPFAKKGKVPENGDFEP